MVALLNTRVVDVEELERLPTRYTWLLSRRCMMFRKTEAGFDESTIASSGVVDEPVKLLQPVPEIQRKVLTRESPLTQFQAARMLPL